MDGFFIGLLIAFLMLAWSGISFYNAWVDWWHRNWDIRRLRRVTWFSIPELNGIPLDGWVRSSGELGSSQGMITAPLSGKQCLYWRIEVKAYRGLGLRAHKTRLHSRNILHLTDGKGHSLPLRMQHMLVTGAEYDLGGLSHGVFFHPTFKSEDGSGLEKLGIKKQNSTQYTISEEVLFDNYPAAVLAQVGQDGQGKRFLHAKKRRGTVTLSSDADAIEKLAKQRFSILGKDLRRAILAFAFGTAILGIYFVFFAGPHFFPHFSQVFATVMTGLIAALCIGILLVGLLVMIGRIMRHRKPEDLHTLLTAAAIVWYPVGLPIVWGAGEYYGIKLLFPLALLASSLLALLFFARLNLFVSQKPKPSRPAKPMAFLIPAWLCCFGAGQAMHMGWGWTWQAWIFAVVSPIVIWVLGLLHIRKHLASSSQLDQAERK